MRMLALAAASCLILAPPALIGCGAPPASAPRAHTPQTPPGIAAQAQAPSAHGALDQAVALFGPASAIAATGGERVLSAALVELLPDEPRSPRKGGSAAALLADPMSTLNVAKNLALCRALFADFDLPDASASAAARPIYWLARSAAIEAAGADRCASRLAAYDYERAAHMHRVLGLSSDGPFLVLERADPAGGARVAAVLDLARARTEQIAAMVAHFRATLVEAEDSWAPALYQRAGSEASLAALFSGPAAARMLRASRDPGCAAARFLDRCETSG